MKKYLSIFALLAVTAGSASAQVSVTAPWVRATVPAQKSTGAFMHLLAPAPARLVAVTSDVADMVELHKMEMNGDRMKMQQVDFIDLPAGKTVNLASGSFHIMLMGLKRQMKAGETVTLTLLVQGKDKKQEKLTVKVPVKPINFSSPAAAPAMH